MGSIRIQDTGYIKPTNEGTQASSANMANSGNAVILQSAEFTPNLKRNVQDNPEIGIDTPSEINLGSLENMKFTLTCKLKTSNATDMGYVPNLIDMIATNGYKLMWYQYTSATAENNNGQLIYRLATNSKLGHILTAGEKTEFTISEAFYHLHVLFTNIQPRHSAGSSIITYVLTGIVMKVEDSTI